LSRLTGRYALGKDAVLSVTEEKGHLFVQENDEPRLIFYTIQVEVVHFQGVAILKSA
jgi:hypothetical protein